MTTTNCRLRLSSLDRHSTWFWTPQPSGQLGLFDSRYSSRYFQLTSDFPSVSQKGSSLVVHFVYCLHSNIALYSTFDAHRLWYLPLLTGRRANHLASLARSRWKTRPPLVPARRPA